MKLQSVVGRAAVIRRLVGTGGLLRMGTYYLIGTEFLFHKIKKFYGWTVVMVA